MSATSLTPPPRTRRRSASSMLDSGSQQAQPQPTPTDGGEGPREPRASRAKRRLGGELNDSSACTRPLAIDTSTSGTAFIDGVRRSSRPRTPSSTASSTPKAGQPRVPRRRTNKQSTDTQASPAGTPTRPIVKKRRRSPVKDDSGLPVAPPSAKLRERTRGGRGRRSHTDGSNPAGQPAPIAPASVAAVASVPSDGAAGAQLPSIPPAALPAQHPQPRSRKAQKYRRRNGQQRNAQNQAPQPQSQSQAPSSQPVVDSFVPHQPMFETPANCNMPHATQESPTSHQRPNRGRGGRNSRGSRGAKRSRSRGGITPARLPPERLEAPHNTNNYLMNNVCIPSPDTRDLLVPVAAQYGSMAQQLALQPLAMATPIYQTLSDRRDDGAPADALMLDANEYSEGLSGDASSIGEDDMGAGENDWQNEMLAAGEKLQSGASSWEAPQPIPQLRKSRKKRARGSYKRRNIRKKQNGAPEPSSTDMVDVGDATTGPSTVAPLQPHPTRRSSLVALPSPIDRAGRGLSHGSSTALTPMSITPSVSALASSHPSTRSTSRSPANSQTMPTPPP